MKAIITFHRADNSLIGEPEVRHLDVGALDPQVSALISELNQRVADPDDELDTFAVIIKNTEPTDG